jgi:hypothetical protein
MPDAATTLARPAPTPMAVDLDAITVPDVEVTRWAVITGLPTLAACAEAPASAAVDNAA